MRKVQAVSLKANPPVDLLTKRRLHFFFIFDSPGAQTLASLKHPTHAETGSEKQNSF